jgi:dTDP-4-dehydrorhamnose 3,5-epimerase
MSKVIDEADSLMLKKFDIHKINVEFLQALKFKKQNIYHPPTIQGVVQKDYKIIPDGRGSITELWSQPWLKQLPLVNPVHIYKSRTDFGIVKCWHLHALHTDQLSATIGKLQVCLVDLRPTSPTFCHVCSVFMGEEAPRMLKIPPGIMHGWKALSSPYVDVFNFQSHAYDPADEVKIPWNCVLEEIWEPKNG